MYKKYLNITRGFLCGTLDHDHQSIPSDLSNRDDSYIQVMARWKIKYEMTCNCSHVRMIALHKFLFKKKTWLAIVCTCEQLQSKNSKIKYEMTCNCLHIRTIALHKF
jgi:hypothetical protein